MQKIQVLQVTEVRAVFQAAGASQVVAIIASLSEARPTGVSRAGNPQWGRQPDCAGDCFPEKNRIGVNLRFNFFDFSPCFYWTSVAGSPA